METLDDVLAHYGILGMKWGVRRDRKQLARAKKKTNETSKASKTSEDAEKAKASRKKAKKGGVSALSNEELKQLTARMNLEQQYSRLTKKPSKLKKGHEAVKVVLGVGKTANEIAQFANSPMGKELAKQLKQKK